MRMYTLPALGEPEGILVSDILFLKKAEEVSTGVVSVKAGYLEEGNPAFTYFGNGGQKPESTPDSQSYSS